jgi:hypothetical protein
MQIIYNLIYLKNSFEPLRDHIGHNDCQFKDFKTKKSALSFCIWNECMPFKEILTECYQMEHDQVPNYGKLVF